MRLNKYIAEQTVRSRREADELIRQGRVKLAQAGSQTTAQLGQQMTESDKVLIDGRLVEPRRRQTTIILNKPVGYLSSRRSQGGDPTIYDLLPARYRQLKTAGRLDKDSSGLMVLSSDGDLIQRLTHPRYRKQKVYQVQLDRPLSPTDQQLITRDGVNLPDGKSKFSLIKSGEDRLKLIQDIEAAESGEYPSTSLPALRTNGADRATGSPPSPSLRSKLGLGMGMSPGSDRLGRTAEVEGCSPDSADQTFATFHREPDFVDDKYWTVTMHEGRNRQIRRTFAALGYTVVRLHRVQLGDYRLGDLAAGNFRQISV